MQDKLNKLLNADLSIMAENGKKLLYENYTVDKTYKLITEKFI